MFRRILCPNILELAKDFSQLIKCRELLEVLRVTCVRLWHEIGQVRRALVALEVGGAVVDHVVGHHKHPQGVLRA